MGDKSLDFRHHPVLAVISNCYSEPKGRFPRVTHPCATKAEAFVRLACVRHAASVRSEPGSNSQVCVTICTARVNPPTAIPNFRSRYLHLSNVMDTKDMSDIGIKNRYPEPEARRTGRRRPHVPSSKTDNVKEPPTTAEATKSGGQPSFPDFCFRGTCCPSMLATGRFCRLRRRSRPVKRPLEGASDSVNAFLQFCFKNFRNPRNSAVSGLNFMHWRLFRRAGATIAGAESGPIHPANPGRFHLCAVPGARA